MDVIVEQLEQDRWQARARVSTPAGPRYFLQSGPNRTAALLSLSQSMRAYQGDAYREAQAAILAQASA